MYVVLFAGFIYRAHPWFKLSRPAFKKVTLASVWLLSIAGLPPLLGFYLKWYLAYELSSVNTPLTLVLSLFGALAVLWYLQWLASILVRSNLERGVSLRLTTQLRGLMFIIFM